MKASQLIRHLAIIIEEKGDVPILVSDGVNVTEPGYDGFEYEEQANYLSCGQIGKHIIIRAD